MTSGVYLAPESPDGKFESVMPSDVVETMRTALVHARETGSTIVGWNTQFDVAWLIASGLRKEVFACKWMDAMLMYRHLAQHPTFEMGHETLKQFSFGLKAAVARFIPEAAGYEQGVTFNPTTLEEWARLREYNLKDVEYTIQLAQMFWTQLTPAQRRVIKIEAESIPLVADSVVRGIVADREAADALQLKLEEDAAVAFVKLKLRNGEVTKQVLASPKQLANLLYDTWGLEAPKYTDTGKESTDRETLLLLATEDPRAGLINAYREANNNATKFASATIDSLNYNCGDTVHPQPRMYGTYTGRMTYSSSQGRGKQEVPTGVALHQWKRDKEFRKLLRAPEGYDLLEFDFAGQEFRWMAVVSNDITMLSMCQPGEDAHMFMGANIKHVPYEQAKRELAAGNPEIKNVRQLGKVANLSLQYMTSANRLRRMAATQYGIAMGSDEAYHIHKTYRSTYKQVPKYWREQAWKVGTQDHITNLIGRDIHFVKREMRDPNMRWSYEATAVNYPIQSMGAEQKYLALMVARNVLPKFRGYFYYELHDGLFFIVPNIYTRTACKVLKQELSNLPYRKAWGRDFPISFPVDAKHGPSWGELVEYKP